MAASGGDAAGAAEGAARKGTLFQRRKPTDAPNPADQAAEPPKSRAPANTAFKQQRLRAWRPILTPRLVLALFIVTGVFFATMGALMLWASSQVLPSLSAADPSGPRALRRSSSAAPGSAQQCLPVSSSASPQRRLAALAAWSGLPCARAQVHEVESTDYSKTCCVENCGNDLSPSWCLAAASLSDLYKRGPSWRSMLAQQQLLAMLTPPSHRACPRKPSLTAELAWIFVCHICVCHICVTN